jgi:hypothetical protein
MGFNRETSRYTSASSSRNSIEENHPVDRTGVVKKPLSFLTNADRDDKEPLIQFAGKCRSSKLDRVHQPCQCGTGECEC